MTTLTISVAAYNVGAYLKQTLDSFRVPELEEKLEVLIVDDGSKDDTVSIAQEYEDQCPSIFRLIRKENGGHGSTINKGLEEAAGKYFKIVDGDDWVNRDALIQLVSYLENAKEDLVFTNYCKVFGTKEEKVNNFAHVDSHISYSEQDFPLIENLSMHNITIKTDVLRSNKIKISEKCFYVDLEFKLYSIALAKSYRFLDLYVYQYRLGLAEQSVNIKNMTKNIHMHKKVSQVCLDYYISHVRDNETFGWDKKEFLKTSIVRIVGDQLRLFVFLKPNVQVKDDMKQYDLSVKNKDLDIYMDAEKVFTLLPSIRKSGYGSLTLPHLLLLIKVRLSNLIKKIR